MRSSSGCIFVLILTYFQVAQAYTKFEPECTNPKETVNFVDSPPTRGTLDILWSSLFTIFACTYSILHLNVPEQRDDRDPGVGGDIKWFMKAIWSKMKWMLVTVIAPELLLFIATSRFLYAREQHPNIKKLADADGVPWTLAHTTFADMGGFAVRGSSGRIGKESPTLEIPPDRVSKELPTPEIPPDRVEKEPSTPDISPIPTQPQVDEGAPICTAPREWYFLTLDIILELRSKKHIKLPYIRKAEIDDHSQGDNFAKVVAAAQIIWTIANVITRAARRLPVSQLEISVIAFSVCALIIYACYWSSPKDVSVPVTFLQWEGPIPSAITEIITGTVKKAGSQRFRISRGVEIAQYPISNIFVYRTKNVLGPLSLFLGALVFGAPHLLAWNLTFPTPAERNIWRAAALYCSSSGLIVIATSALGERLNSLTNAIISITVVAYVLARLFLIVEMFRTLLFLPPGAYIATWTSSVPMFG
ncbi:hypothetical protein V491_05772 [Pseudogymnoascus sp. VKM F-3775]|nr:hypothetical protein V491_05772 [Pseudogymnoascus sp. VKM F-3775]